MMQSAFGDLSTVLVAGALDELDADGLRKLAPRGSEPRILLALTDGAAVVRSDDLRLLLEAKLKRLTEQGVDLVVLTCTGEFSGLTPAVPALIPAAIVDRLVPSMVPAGGRLGVVVPLAEQVEAARERWSRLGYHVSVIAAWPLGDPSEVDAAGEELSRVQPDLILLDAFCYTREHKMRLQEQVNALIILPQELVITLALQLVN